MLPKTSHTLPAQHFRLGKPSKSGVSNHSSPISVFRKMPPLAWLMLSTLALSLLGEEGIIAAWIVVALWAVSGADQAVEALLVSVVLNALNPGIFARSEIGLSLRWFILALASFRVGYAWAKDGFKQPSWFRYFLLFVLYAGLAALFVSRLPTVSLFKLMTYSFGSLVIYFGIRLGGKRDWGLNILAFGAILAILSLPLLGISEGRLLNGTQFQGILAHPQQYGVLVSIPLGYAIAVWLLDRNSRLRWYQVVLLVAIGSTALLSGARAGYFAVFVSVVVSVLSTKSLGILLSRLAFHPFTYFGIGALIIVFWVTNPVDQIKSLIFERESDVYAYYGLYLSADDPILTHVLASRLGLIEDSWRNFLVHPVAGIGFGIPSSVSFDTLTQTLGGIPVTFPVEKGFLVTALLEEVGLVGATLFFLLILSQLRVLGASLLLPYVMLYVVALFVNFGESVYFALGSTGVLVHAAMSTALAQSERAPNGSVISNSKRAICTIQDRHGH